jgi:hypothetical protein
MCRTLPIAPIGALLLAGWLASVTSPDALAGAQDRNAWLYKADGKQGWFKKEDGKQWLETTADGGLLAFEETARTPKYVELFDKSRIIRVRLHADFAEFREGDKREWSRLTTGRWVGVADLPKRVQRDYLIRLAYFVPSDREPTKDYAKKIRVAMHFVAEMYRQDFEARHIDSKGLRFESKGGEPVVHLIHGKRPAAFYNGAPNYDGGNQWKTVQAEMPASTSPARNVVIVFAETYDPGPAKSEWPGGVALGGNHSTEGGFALFSAWILRPEFCATTVAKQKELLFDATPIKDRTAVGHGSVNSPRFYFIEDGFGAVAHELGHALGLPHDNRQPLNIMGNGFRKMRSNFTEKPDPTKRVGFSDDNARILYSSRYLASDLVLSDLLPPTVKLGWVGAMKAGDTTIKVSVTASDNQGLRAILFISPAQDSVVGGRALTGKTQTFEQTLSVRPLQPGPYQLEALVADVGGNTALTVWKGSVGK